MLYFIFLIICVIIVELFIILNLKKEFSFIVSLTRTAMHALTSKTLEDHKKEVIIRKSSLSMLKVTFILSMKIMIIVFVFYAIYIISTYFVIVTKKDFSEKIVSPIILIAMTILSILYMQIRNVITKRL